VTQGTAAERSPSAAGRWLFVAAIFASAFLIFLVQPMVGKRILPWFGGAPSVWSLCLAFYQTTLLAGYLYAHLLVRYVGPRQQLGVHALLLVAAVWVLPVLPDDSWQPMGEADPSAQVLGILSANVALPFLLLASTGPLVQAWFARLYPGRSPYPLYAVSNVGSLLALLAYPFVFEPRLALSTTGEFWSAAFVLACLAVLGCGVLARRAPTLEPAAPSRGDAGGDGRLDFVHVVFWMGLAACAVLLLMGVTNKLCLDMASVPFLWILPLAVYLLTFILCFALPRSYRRTPYVIFSAGVFVLGVGQFIWQSWFDASAGSLSIPVYEYIPAYCALLFGLCMLLHGELHRLRPPADSLTAYYLCVSAGGALGGLFVGIGAPLVFSDYYEFELGLAGTVWLVLFACAHDPASVLRASGPRWRWGLVAPLVLGLMLAAGWRTVQPRDGLRQQERTFFGVLRVLDNGEGIHAQRHLTSGTTLHGVQFQAPSAKHLPTSYFGRASGVGLSLLQRAPGEATRVGIIGLGVGTLAAYGRPGDYFRFYELDPAVVRIARDDGDFDFVKRSRAEVDLVVGDARLSLAREQEDGTPQAFDHLVVDAFSSDAIPVHLLTVEAFAHYDAALAPGGVLAFHLSNRHFELMPLVARLGVEMGYSSIQVFNPRTPEFQSQASKWVLMAREPERLDALWASILHLYAEMKLDAARLGVARTQPAEVRHLPVWTDDYSDVFSVLRPMQ